MQLTEYEMKLLLAATKGDGQKIEVTKYDTLWKLKIDDSPEVSSETPRLEAMYKSAFDGLLKKKLIAEAGSYQSGSKMRGGISSIAIFTHIYKATEKGFVLGDKLS